MLLGSVEYSTPIDIWGVGCIFMEMVSGRPLFPGSVVEDQLLLIWKVLGTPTEDTWPGLHALPDYKPGKWSPHRRTDLAAELPRSGRARPGWRWKKAERMVPAWRGSPRGRAGGWRGARLERAGHDLLNRMLEYNPRARIATLAAMQHPYFANLEIPLDLPHSALARAPVGLGTAYFFLTECAQPNPSSCARTSSSSQHSS